MYLLDVGVAIAWFIFLIVIGSGIKHSLEKSVDSKAGTPIVKAYKNYRRWPPWLRTASQFVWGISITALVFWIYIVL